MQHRTDRKPSIHRKGKLPTPEVLAERMEERELKRKHLAKLAAGAFPNDRGNYNLPYPRSQMPSRQRGYAMPTGGIDALLGLMLAAAAGRKRRAV